MGSFHNSAKAFFVSEQSQGSNHPAVSRKELNAGVEQVALYWVDEWFLGTWAQVQLQMKASKFKCLEMNVVSTLPLLSEAFRVSFNRVNKMSYLGQRINQKTPWMVLSSALTQLSEHRSLMSLEMSAMVWQIWLICCWNACPSGRELEASRALLGVLFVSVLECISKSTEPLNSINSYLMCRGLNRFPDLELIHICNVSFLAMRIPHEKWSLVRWLQLSSVRSGKSLLPFDMDPGGVLTPQFHTDIEYKGEMYQESGGYRNHMKSYG